MPSNRGGDSTTMKSFFLRIKYGKANITIMENDTIFHILGNAFFAFDAYSQYRLTGISSTTSVIEHFPLYSSNIFPVG